MDKQEAKLILSSYTLGNEPQNDPKFVQAKKLAESDPELAQWWEKQKSEDRLLAGSLSAFEPPADLRSALNATVENNYRRKLLFVQFKRFAMVAAAFAVCSYLFFVYGIDRSDDYQGPLAERAYDYSVDGPRLTYFNKDTASLRSWLTTNGFPVPQQLPPKLLDLEGVGCRPLNWSEDRVALMCFNADTVYHLFIGMDKDFPEFEASEKIGYDQYADGWAISKWKDDDYLFVLTAKTTVNEMAGYLASYDPASNASGF